jgi:hypothetical protein
MLSAAFFVRSTTFGRIFSSGHFIISPRRLLEAESRAFSMMLVARAQDRAQSIYCLLCRRLRKVRERASTRSGALHQWLGAGEASGVGDGYLANGAPRSCGGGEVARILARAPGCGRQQVGLNNAATTK